MQSYMKTVSKPTISINDNRSREYSDAQLADLIDAAGFDLEWDIKTQKAKVTVNDEVIIFEKLNIIDNQIMIDEAVFKGQVNSVSGKTGVTITSISVDSKTISIVKQYMVGNKPVIVTGIVQHNRSNIGINRTSRSSVCIALAAGIQTNASFNMFGDLKKELAIRYLAEGMTSIRFIEIFPLGEGKNTSPLGQMIKVGINMAKGTGGKDTADAIIANKCGARQLVLIGHSGGGQAVGDALTDLAKKEIDINTTVQIGAPPEPLQKKYADKTIRIQTKTDVVSKYVPSQGTKIITDSINPIGGIYHSILNAFNKKMPETIYVDIGINDSHGGHISYFNRNLCNSKGVDNITTIVDAMWDKIK